MGPTLTTAYKRLAALISEKHNQQYSTTLEMLPEPVPHQICHHVPPWSKVHLPPPNLLRGLNGCGLLRRPHLYPGLNNSNPYNIFVLFSLFCFVYVHKYLCYLWSKKTKTARYAVVCHYAISCTAFTPRVLHFSAFHYISNQNSTTN